ncbi:MAG: TetR/AcrR family transcriptional regulator [Bacilli bacterium]
MGRKKKVEKQHLYVLLRTLLPLHGYERLTFSLLAKELEIGRSTIYEYFTNKDELIVNYMLYDMNELLERWNVIAVSNVSDIQKITQMISLFHTYSAVHQGVKAIPSVRKQADESLLLLLFELRTLHDQLFASITTTISNAIKNGTLTKECDAIAVSQFIFYSIDMPKPPHLNEEEWLLQLHNLILNGIQAK